MMRKTGEISATRDLASGDHVCLTFASDSEHDATLAAFFAEGLERGERIAYLAPQPLRDRLPDRIGEHDTAALIRSGRFVVLPSEDAYEAGTDFDYESLLRSGAALAEETERAGYPGLRSAGETGWLLEQLGPGEEFSRYEFRSEILVASTPSLTALCCYDMRALHPTAVGLAQALHPARLGPAGDDVGFTLTCSGDGVAAISGEIDCAFADQVGSLIEDSAGQITTLDLSQLRFADITGLRALSGAAERIRWTHGDVRIQGASPSFRRLWKILGLDDRVRGSFDDS